MNQKQDNNKEGFYMNTDHKQLKQDLFRLRELVEYYNRLTVERDNLLNQVKEINKDIKKTEQEILFSEQKIRIRTDKV